jgi:ubiquinone/menaquinone biosynthesis C-methylase UbiE
MSNTAPAPSPTAILTAATAYQKTAALKAAVELGLFSAVPKDGATAEEIAARIGAAPRGARILSDYLTVNGFLEKHEGRYWLSPESAAFLDRNSPTYIGSILDFLASPEILEAHLRDPAGVVRRGGTGAAEGGTVSEENPVWVKFARGMAPMMALPAQLLAQLVIMGGEPRHVLDIAAGHGLFGITIARQAPGTRIVAQDWPAVLEVASENARQAGIEDRFERRPGSAFTVPFGGPYDVILVTNFLHHFDPATCTTLLRKCRDALDAKGRVVVLEFVPNEDRVSPPVPAMFSFVMLGGTPAGDAYTYPELDRMLRDAGFTRTEMHDLPPTEQRVVVGYV